MGTRLIHRVEVRRRKYGSGAIDYDIVKGPCINV